MKLIKLNITQQHINLADEYTGENTMKFCPLAYCLRDMGYIDPEVTIEFGTGKVVVFHGPDENDQDELAIDSQILRTWVDNYDDGFEVFPLSIDLEVIE